MNGCRRIVLPAQLRCLATLGALLLGPTLADAEVPTRGEMEDVCRSWISYRAREAWRPNAWASEEPRILRADELWGSLGETHRDTNAAGGNETLLAIAFQIEPDGYVVVPALRELPPIKAYSEDGRFDTSATEGFPALVRDVLESRFSLFEVTFGSLDVAPTDGAVFDPEQREAWIRLAEGYPSQDTAAGIAESRTAWPRSGGQYGPLMSTAWHQGDPYQNLCPIGDYGWLCPVGCVATAVGQILNYYQWPPNGTGSHSYFWDGDDSCTETVPGQELSADFSDPYDWDSMVDSCDGGCTEDQMNALAELCYEFGVAVEMDYGVCGSDALSNNVVDALVTHYRYFDNMEILLRAGYPMEEWFALVQDEIDAGRPIYYDILSHAGVVDGWRDELGILQYHFNYGWGGPSTAWYVVDGISGSSDPMFESMIVGIMPEPENPFLVFPDGSGVFSTIQEAIDAARLGDVIELADGLYRGVGNRNIDFNGKRVTLRSRNGDPASCAIDAEGTDEEPHVGVIFNSGEQSNTILEGITIENGVGRNRGGGIYLYNSSPLIRNCVVKNCRSDGWFYGGVYIYSSTVRFERCEIRQNTGRGVYANNSIPTFEECVFVDNSSTGLHIFNSYAPTIRSCTFSGNGLDGMYMETTLDGTVENTILAFSTTGRGLVADGNPPTLSCTDIYGNEGGDWVGTISDQLGTGGNLSEDPLFCSGDPDLEFHLAIESPCAPDGNPDCGLIGARPAVCSSANVFDTDGSVDRPASRVWPNPMTNGCVIRFSSGSERRESSLSIEIVDAAGRFVRRLEVRQPEGELRAEWDGRDSRGELVPGGVYFVRTGSDHRGSLERVVVIR